jgi:DNA polymerase elongation subunit (family B)
MTHKIFPYSWHIDEKQEERTIIRIYGLNEKSQSISVTINDFTPYIYLELPEKIEWNETRANMLGKKIDDICGKFRPLKKCLSFKKKLYYANVTQKQNYYTYRKFPFLMLSFSSPLDIKKVMYRLNKPMIVSGIGTVHVKVHEQDANAILQLVCVKDIPTAGWFYFKGKETVGYDKETYCKHEYVVKWRNIARVKSEMKMPLPLIMGFDIEVNSTNPNVMPSAKKPGDKVFQISCVLSRPNDTDDKFQRFLLTH